MLDIDRQEIINKQKTMMKAISDKNNENINENDIVKHLQDCLVTLLSESERSKFFQLSNTKTAKIFKISLDYLIYGSIKREAYEDGLSKHLSDNKELRDKFFSFRSGAHFLTRLYNEKRFDLLEKYEIQDLEKKLENYYKNKSIDFYSIIHDFLSKRLPENYMLLISDYFVINSNTEKMLNDLKNLNDGNSNKTNFEMEEIKKSIDDRCKKSQSKKKNQPLVEIAKGSFAKGTTSLSDDRKDDENKPRFNELKDESIDSSKVLTEKIKSLNLEEDVNTSSTEFLVLGYHKLLLEDIDSLFDRKMKVFIENILEKYIKEFASKKLEGFLNELKVQMLCEVKSLKNCIVQQNDTVIIRLLGNKKLTGVEIVSELCMMNKSEFIQAILACNKQNEVYEKFDSHNRANLLKKLIQYIHVKQYYDILSDCVEKLLFDININEIFNEHIEHLYKYIDVLESSDMIKSQDNPDLVYLLIFTKKRLTKRIQQISTVKFEKNCE
ncbi:hypothetical protein HERIO_2397 [Hepatospora eriocheir]|uniref:Uncharacterized protein n=1 Tax=Hepatospora eriocheir TaxID=1081669 RepID=A0A1X0Q744_9MICR|nr:hypothetical protein HERIO_2397 [Hepatospora eriocheir]